MISCIKISNYALIRELTVNPGPGFNIITGETGAGKSIILGALSLLLGKRVDIKAIAVPEEKSSVEIEFILNDGTVRTLRREILPSGRSKASIDGVQVSVSEMSEIAAKLIDIHSQHQNTLLTDTDFQLKVVDDLANNSELLEKYHEAYSNYRSALQKYVNTRDDIERTKTDADFLEYQLNEFKGIEFKPGEDEELEKIFELISQRADVVETLSSAYNVLDGDRDVSIMTLLNIAVEKLVSASEISEKYQFITDSLNKIKDNLQEISAEIEREVSQMEDDLSSLDEIRDKLDKINQLKKRHHVSSVEALIDIRDSISARLEALHNSEVLLRDLEQNARRMKKNALELATEISNRRKSAAEILEKEWMERARPLGMENLVVQCCISTGKLNKDGIDTADFLFAFNKNQQPSPASNRASGGEISRLMLALKSITVEHSMTPTIIFDEIDTGVSGDVANRMGRLMDIIAKHTQVITITHLPQVAARGDRHFKVYKLDDAHSTRTYIAELSSENRRGEIALMLSGSSSDPSALATAQSLLNNTI